MKKNSKIAIIGGGPMGLAVAYEFCLQGYKPTVYEADNRLGGMAACFNFEGLEIERYYHFHCLSDSGFINILNEFGIKDQLRWKKTKMGFYYKNKLYKWGSISSVIFFPKVSPITRIRYLLHAARCLLINDWSKLDYIKATTWLKKWLGNEGFQVLWEKLFSYKFYNYSDEISAAWIWSRIKRLGKSRKFFKENLGYLKFGSIQLINKFSIFINKSGGQIKLSSPVLNIEPSEISGVNIKTAKDEECFDLVISTIPLPLVCEIFIKSKINNSVVHKYKNLSYVACVCVIFKTRKKITNNFWTNINDERFSIPGIIEMSNLRDLPNHITYIPFYIPDDHPNYLRKNEEFIKEAWNCLRTINKKLKKSDLIASHCNRYRFAQPVCGVNHKSNLPSQEPFPGLFTVDTSAYYPEDRGISESIDFGRNLVRKILKKNKVDFEKIPK